MENACRKKIEERIEKRSSKLAENNQLSRRRALFIPRGTPLGYCVEQGQTKKGGAPPIAEIKKTSEEVQRE